MLCFLSATNVYLLPEFLIEHRTADNEDERVTGYDEDHCEELDARYASKIQIFVSWSAEFFQIRRHGEGQQYLRQHIRRRCVPLDAENVV